MRNLIFTFVFAAICSVYAFAENYYYTESQNGQILFYSEDDNGICTLLCPHWCSENLNGYTDIVSADYYYTGDIVIPNSINIIGEYAFACYNNLMNWYVDNNSLTSVTIPNSVTSISEGAFRACNGLTAVYYTGNITEWCGINFRYDDYGFENPLYYAHNLYINNELVTNLVIPETLTKIKDYTFAGASCLTSVTIPNSVTEIGEGAFYDCSGLTSVTIPNSVTSIGDRAFSSCTGLTSVTIPNSITSISGYTFSDCIGLTSVTIPNSVTDIYSYAFSGCTGLTSVTIPNSVTDIYSYAFSGCTGLTSVTIPNSVTDIYSYAFSGCSGLTSVTIPNSVTYIGESAFANCTGLSLITIGEGVTSIYDNAFKGCSGLTTVNYNATNCTRMGSESNPVFANCSSFTLNIGANVVIIPENAFKGCSSFTSIVSRATNPPAIYASSFESNLSPMTPLTVPCGTTADYQRYWYYFRNIQEDCTDVSDDYLSELSIFPNPATDILNISSPETISSIEIVNTLGQVVMQMDVNDDNAVCDVENLPNGFYVVRIYNEDTKSFWQKKFAKE